MIYRRALVSLFAAVLVCVPALASQAQKLAGKFVTNPAVAGEVGENGLPGVSCVASFGWLETFSPRQLDSADTATLEMAIIPLRSGSTQVVLYDTARNEPVAEIRFSGGLVKGLPYDGSDWNDVAVTLRPGTQDYTVTVNGVTAGPFAYDGFCQQQGGCFTLGAFTLRGHSASEGSVAWMDTVSLYRESTAGRETIRQVTFDNPCSDTFVTTGGLLISEPPQRTRSRR